MRGFIFSENKLSKYAKKIFLAPKPAPFTESKFYNRQNYQLGSMSHYLNTKVCGYQDLPDFPEEAPDSTVRNVEPPKGIAQKIRIKKSFYPMPFLAPNPWEKTVEANKAKKKAGKAKAAKGFYSEESENDYDDDDEDSSSDSEESSSGEEESRQTTKKEEAKVVQKDNNTLLLMTEDYKKENTDEDSSSDR